MVAGPPELLLMLQFSTTPVISTAGTGPAPGSAANIRAEPPPGLVSWLSVMLQPVRLSAPPNMVSAPPRIPAVLREKVVLVIVALVPRISSKPPPYCEVRQFTTTQESTFKVTKSAVIAPPVP